MLEFGGGIRWSNPTILIIIIECPNVTVDYLWGQGCTVQCSHGLAGVTSASCDSISCVVIAGHPGPGSGDSHVSGWAAADAADTDIDTEGSGECLVCLRRSRRWMDGDINL